MAIVFVVSAPSGTGKSTLVTGLLDRDENLEFAVSVTTRPPRVTETDGKSYHFVSERDFARMRARGELVESAEVFGYWYGTPHASVKAALQRGKDVLLDIDVEGTALLRKKYNNAVTVFVLPPSREQLEARLRQRSADASAVIKRRLGGASREIGKYRLYDYVVINDSVNAAVSKLHAILLAERSKRQNMEPEIGDILRGFGVEPEEGAAVTE